MASASPRPARSRPPAAGRPGRYRTREAYLDAMRRGGRPGNLDIILTSASTGSGWPPTAR